MTRIQTIIILSIALIAIPLAGYGGYRYVSQQRKIEAAAIETYFDQARAFERRIIDGFPIYQDWATPDRERQLRTHLLEDHLAVVRSMNLTAIEDRIELDARLKAGTLTALEQNRETPYFFYNVKKEHRALLPMASEGLHLIAERLNKRTGMKDVTVKMAISSVLRTVEYQDGLRDRNANASLISSHSYGISFDIFYDNFFVSLAPLPDTGDVDVNRSLETMRLRTGYWLGDALRRQLHAMLAETLIELQNEGKLYAILEKNQRCYHVTIRPQ
ncbi:MAG: hypothetical protein F9K24_16625 [Leptonema illini]|uniref:Uncharacterized protein n=1 Tax=Leptonema illini TaxID=183 RepID=A0A833GZB9_9LEPT|nr:MAG: hypothetical protein F9K24_16625 [Leptonema illini]